METATKIDAELRKIIDSSHVLAKKIILENKEDVELIAKTLLEYEQITAEEIDYLLEHRQLKRNGKSNNLLNLLLSMIPNPSMRG